MHNYPSFRRYVHWMLTTSSRTLASGSNKKLGIQSLLQRIKYSVTWCGYLGRDCTGNLLGPQHQQLMHG